MSKIVLAQINTVAGDIKNNKDKIIKCISNAKEINADLIIFPKFALTGYPFGDILKRHCSIFKFQDKAIQEIAEKTKNLVAIINYADLNGDNQISIIKDGKILEDSTFEINGETFGIGFSSEVKTLIKCTSDESRNGVEFERNKLYSSLAKGSHSKIIYVNQVGYGDNRVFDGSSRIYNENGELIVRAKTFEEDIVIVENYQGKIEQMPNGTDKEINIEEFNLDYENDLERTYKSLIFAIKEYFAVLLYFPKFCLSFHQPVTGYMPI